MLPLDETIREDLEALLDRNRDIDRLHRLIQDVENDILSPNFTANALHTSARLRKSGITSKASNSQPQPHKSRPLTGSSPPHRKKRRRSDSRYPIPRLSRLKIATVTDDLALLIVAWQIIAAVRTSIMVRCLIKNGVTFTTASAVRR